MTSEAAELLPRVLRGLDDRPMARLEHHLDVHGPLPSSDPRELIALVEAAGLLGRGGASFPVSKKMRAVTSRTGPRIVVANGCEGEPASRKDRLLLRRLPHLVLDGAAVAARAVGADVAIVAVPDHDVRSVDALGSALRERRAQSPGDEPSYELAGIEPHYLAGQESALVSALGGGPGKPSFTPPRPFEAGVHGLPTLVQNVETLAHLALIARHGADWFRRLGTPGGPGSTLVTVSGAVASPGVYEIEHGALLERVLEAAGVEDSHGAVLVGGYFGTWLTPSEVPRLRLAAESIAEHGASVGAGVIVALDAGACPVAESSRIAEFFAAQSAGQCGPCVFGLDAIARTVSQLAAGTASGTAQHDLERWARQLRRRGACQHPDGAIRFISSSLRAFETEFRDHARRGPCERCASPPLLPTPLWRRR